MAIRMIEEQDLAQVQGLLCEGFPRQTPAYWARALDILKHRPAVTDLPRYGYAIDTDGRLDGVLLTIASKRGDRAFCNLSSWYVRESQRASSIFLLRRALRHKDVTFTDISPVTSIVEMIGKLGFQAHTGGVVLLSPANLFHRSNLPVAGLDRAALDLTDAEDTQRLRHHLESGCQGLRVGGEPALYRIKYLKKSLPCARFVSGTPQRLIDSAGPLMRHLTMRGIPFAMIDVPEGLRPSHGRHYPTRELRYAAGGTPLPAGDLLETELALFGP